MGICLASAFRYVEIAVLIPNFTDMTTCAVVEGSRQVLFGLHSRIGVDFGILIAWGVVNTLFFPICCWFQRKWIYLVVRLPFCGPKY